MTLLHDLGFAVIRSVSVSDMNNNVYLVTSRTSGAQVLIDAANDWPVIEGMLEDARDDAAAATSVGAIVTTHQHRDHIGALAEARRATGAPLLAGADDADAIEGHTGVAIDRRLSHGDTVAVDDLSLGIVHLRGHTPGSVALVLDGTSGPTHLFTGDSLFPGGVGNTWGDAGRFEQLFTDVSERLFGAFGDDTHVHPGHGAGTTLGAERPHLEEWRARGW
ncbi:MAG: MBL fold metallo-hydrolase [Salinibacterium sp.]|nr:MBL fold metallo-hydrolase [Salinibacterium sp.]MBF0671711.1 MBL fold metallo-hydrolase [Salinibacterium sp.]